MKIMGGSYNEAREIPLDEANRVMEFVRIESDLEKMKAQNAKSK